MTTLAPFALQVAGSVAEATDLLGEDGVVVGVVALWSAWGCGSSGVGAVHRVAVPKAGYGTA